MMKKEYDFNKAKRGAIISTNWETHITLYLDKKVLHYYRKKAENFGRGYQSLINEILKNAMDE